MGKWYTAVRMKKIAFVSLRFFMALIFLWAFFDKLLGLGFATPSEQSWLHGGSPTSGFLAHATHGPFAAFFQGFVGIHLVDWVFMIGLLFIGVTLLFNRLLKWGCAAGITMLLLIYFSAFPPMNHPFIDEHLIYVLVLVMIASSKKVVRAQLQPTTP